MYLVISKCVTAVKVSNFSGHYLRNRSTLDIGVLGYIGIVQHKEHSPEILSIPPGTPCMFLFSVQILSEIFHMIRRTERYMIKIYIDLREKCQFFGLILMKLEFSREIFGKYFKKPNFMKIRLVTAELFHGNGRTNGQT